MKKNYTHITVLLDRTGSMEAIRDDVIGGFNTFLDQQKRAPGKATLTLVQFDSQDPYEVIHRFRTIETVPALTRETFVPRATTPLLDAMGHAINDIEQSLAAIPAKERPAKVMLVVVTDGEENASREFRKDQIEKMIKEKTEKKAWQFVFLSADLAAIDDARSVGFQAGAVLLFDKSSDGNRAAWSSLAERTCEYRAAKKQKIGFTQADRERSAQPKS